MTRDEQINRLAALLCPALEVHFHFEEDGRLLGFCHTVATTIAAQGVTVGLDVERLARALVKADQQEVIVLLGTDARTDAKGYPLRTDYSGVEAECTAFVTRAYEEASDG